MRAVVTRVSSASVTIDGTVNGRIGRGFLVLLGVGPNDTQETADRLAEKICNLRVFEAGGVPVHPVRRHLLPPARVLRRRQAGRGHPAV